MPTRPIRFIYRGAVQTVQDSDATLSGLHPRYAEAIKLRLAEERPRTDCAVALGVSVETFDVLLFRAVRAFRKAFGEPDA